MSSIADPASTAIEARRTVRPVGLRADWRSQRLRSPPSVERRARAIGVHADGRSQARS